MTVGSCSPSALSKAPLTNSKPDVRATSGPPRSLDIPIETVVTTVSGTVHSSLWESIASTGEEPALIAEFADVFAWEVDFFRDVREGGQLPDARREALRQG